MDDSDARSSINSDANHACDVIEMALCETFRTVEWVNPDDHFFLEKLAWKLKEVVVCLRGRHAIHLLHLLQVAPIAVPVHVVVLDEHLLTDMVLIQLVGHDVRSLADYQVLHLIFFADDLRSGVQLLQVVHDSVLNVDVNLCEDIIRTLVLLLGNVRKTNLSHALND